MDMRDKIGITGGLYPENLEYFRELNVGWYKWTPEWDDPNFDKTCSGIASMLRELRMKWLFTLQPNFGNPRVDFTKWEGFIHKVYERYGDVIGAFMVGNEPNCVLFFPQNENTIDDYARLLMRSYEIIKKICNLRVLFGCLAGGIFDFYFKVRLKYRDIDSYFDDLALNLHPSYPPKHLRTELKLVTKPVWITETNRCVSETGESYDSKTMGGVVPEDPYTNYINLKEIVETSFELGARAVFFYTIRDRKGGYFADHCGLVSADGKKRPAFYLVKSLCSDFKVPSTDTIYILDYKNRKITARIHSAQLLDIPKKVLDMQRDYWILRDYFS